MPRVVHFEIHADTPEKAMEFYKNTFNWEFKKWDGPEEYWLITTGDKSEPGIDGGLIRRKRAKAHIHNTIDVPSVDEYIEKIKTNGGKIVVEKQTVPGVGYLAFFMDPEGNVFGIMEHNTSAK